MQGTNVGSIYYDVSLDTRKMVDEQRKVDRELKTTTGSLEQFGAKLNTITQAIKAYAAAMALIKVVQLADEIRMLGARVEVAAGSIKDGAAAFDDLVNISRRTQSSLEGNIEVFNRLNQSILQMGGTQADTLHITELLGKAIKVSGASATEAKAAMLQFGQALGSGKLQGDELRSLMETAPYLMKQLADGIGVPIGSLKKLGEEGKLTADVVTNALTKAAAKIDEDFKKLPQTFEAALVVAQDQAALAALKFDELTGSSAALAGITKGAGEVLEQLAEQFANAAGEAEKLDRNGAVKSWAESSREALSYVVDAADVTWQTLSVLGRNVAFVFKGIGSEIGGIGAQIAAVMRGDFAGARAIGEEMKRDAEQRRKDLDAADAATLSRAQTMGEKMRQAWAKGQASASGTGTAPSGKNLKTPGGAAASSGAKFDAAGYLAGLEKEVAEGYEKIGLIEAEALRKNNELLKAGKISREQAARAVNLIESNAAKERMDLALRSAEEYRAAIYEDGQKDIELAKKLEEERQRGRDLATGILGDSDPIAKLEQELATKSELLLQAYMRDQANEQLYAQARVALEQDTAAKIRAIREQQIAAQYQQQSAQMQAYSQLFDGIAGITQSFAGKQSGIYKAMFAASKAFAIADAIVKIQQGIASAAALPFPANIPAMATVAAATGSIVSTIRGTNYGGGRQYGGPVDAGSMYRVGEGNRPEMFVGDSGRSYMIPGERGKVIGNGDLGGGGLVVNVEVVNNGASASPTVSGRLGSDGVAAIRVVLDAVADDLASGGKTARALQSRFNLRA